MERKSKKLSEQVADREGAKTEKKAKYEGSDAQMISTGSTLLDLAISGGRVRGGGVPAGIFVEIFGPSGSGKTTLLCELAGGVQRTGGEVKFMDPEGRLNKAHAASFGLEIDFEDEDQYKRPDTVPEIFKPVRGWKPSNPKTVNGIFADSLAALSTSLEMEGEDKWGMKRAKEFSEGLRKTCRTITNDNLLMVCSNQIRDKIDNAGYGEKFVVPGGKAIAFYSSLRLRVFAPQKIKREKTINGVPHKVVIGVKVMVQVYKSTVWEPYHEAPVFIIFDYGIDDIRANLEYLKTVHKTKGRELDGESLPSGIFHAITEVEEKGWEKKLAREVRRTWMEIDQALRQKRKPKRRG